MPAGDSYKMSDYRKGTAGRVPCPRCGTLLAEDATSCFDCGVHFSGGTAYDFSTATQSSVRGRRFLRIVVVVMLVLATLGFLLLASGSLR